MKYLPIAAALITSAGLIYAMHIPNDYYLVLYWMFMPWLLLTLAYQLYSLAWLCVRVVSKKLAHKSTAIDAGYTARVEGHEAPGSRRRVKVHLHGV